MEYPKMLAGGLVVSSRDEEDALADDRLIVEVVKSAQGDRKVVKGIIPKAKSKKGK